MAARCSIKDRDDWFDIWYEDKISMIDTMVKNMASDLENGYDYFGNSIRSQQDMINAYKADFDATMDSFKTIDDKAINRWCFFDLKKRGVIE